jgi:glyoxylase-like metal-dependent hydrolase (beta-lactamase superfamily II)
MKLNKINGNTYYIDAPTNTGIYIFKNKFCLMIDTGVGVSQAKKVDEILIANNLHPKYIINTHSHLDHCGGNQYFRDNYPGTVVYASDEEKLYMENPELHSSMLFSSSPIKELFKKHRGNPVDYELDLGINKIGDEKFDVISLKGHSKGQIGIITSDRVCFLGDAVFTEDILKKYSIPFLYNIEDSIITLNSLRELEAEHFLMAHSDNPVAPDEFYRLIDLNISNIDKYNNQILELLEQPLTREDLLENLVILNELNLNFTQYHLYLSSISAFITYLYNKDLISYSIENGKIYYYQ